MVVMGGFVPLLMFTSWEVLEWNMDVATVADTRPSPMDDFEWFRRPDDATNNGHFLNRSVTMSVYTMLTLNTHTHKHVNIKSIS